MHETYQARDAREQEAADRVARVHGVFVIRAIRCDTKPLFIHQADNAVWRPPSPVHNPRSKPWAR